VVAYEMYTPEWEARVAKSKFAEEALYARAPSGSIGLQDHGTPVAFKNVKIRPLDGGG
jgi:cytochrome c